MLWFKKKNEKLSQSIVQKQMSTRGAKVMSESFSDRLSAVIGLLRDQPQWDLAIDQNSAKDNALYAAAYMGFSKPFSPEEQQLIKFLSDHFAGRKISTFAWGLYADQLQTENLQYA